MKTEEVILEKLENIEKELKTVKEHMVDIDSILTEEDYQDIIFYREEKKKGKLVSHSQLKKELEF